MCCTPGKADERPIMPKHTPSKCRRPAAPATVTPKPDPRAVLVRRLEVLAGCELQHGFHAAAERLAWRAAALREAAR